MILPVRRRRKPRIKRVHVRRAPKYRKIYTNRLSKKINGERVLYAEDSTWGSAIVSEYERFVGMIIEWNKRRFVFNKSSKVNPIFKVGRIDIIDQKAIKWKKRQSTRKSVKINYDVFNASGVVEPLTVIIFF